MFAKYHYLNNGHNNSAHVYVAIINDVLVGFLSVLHFPHPRVKNIKRVHRLVILPDYQGAGFGREFLNCVGRYYKNKDYRFTITTSNPALLYSLKKDKQWALTNYGRKTRHRSIKMGSEKRITVSFEMKYAN